jgi:hypothetical protein
MSTPLFDRLRTHCHRLRLHRLEAELLVLLEQAAKRDVPYSDFLDELLSLEVRSKAEKHLTMRTAMARFPFQKTIDAFDFKFQPSIDPKVIHELATGRYLESGDNVLLLGPCARLKLSLHSTRDARQYVDRRTPRPTGAPPLLAGDGKCVETCCKPTRLGPASSCGDRTSRRADAGSIPRLSSI